MKILKYGILLILFCLPLYLIRFKILGVPTNVLEIMIGILFLFWLAKKGYKNLFIILKEKLLVWGIILLVVGVSAATIFSWNLKLSAGIWKSWFIVPIVFFIIFFTTIKKEDIKMIFYSLIASGFVISIISLVYLILGKLNFQARLQGIYSSPNYLAMYLAPILIIVLMKICSRINFHKILLFVACILLLVVLFFTKSYGAWLGIFIALIFGVAVYLYGTGKKKIVLLLVFLAFVGIFAFGIIKIQSLEGLKSFDARFVIWERAWQSFEDNFPLGIGPGTFEKYFPPYPQWGVPQPHSIYLAFLLQTGIVGFVGFILVLVWFFWPGFKNFFARGETLPLWGGRLLLIMLMIYILAHGLVDTLYWKNDLAVVFWTIIGAMIILSRPESGSRQRSGEK